MNDLRDLYQEVILDHNRQPRNFRTHPEASHHAEGWNPLCGDRLTVFLDIDSDQRIADVSFQGSGCAISTASASLMTVAVKGKTRDEADALFDKVHAMLTGTEAPDTAALGKLAVFSGVRDYPTRVKCATLAWHTLKAALQGSQEPVTTE